MHEEHIFYIGLIHFVFVYGMKNLPPIQNFIEIDRVKKALGRVLILGAICMTKLGRVITTCVISHTTYMYMCTMYIHYHTSTS